MSLKCHNRTHAPQQHQGGLSHGQGPRLRSSRWFNETQRSRRLNAPPRKRRVSPLSLIKKVSSSSTRNFWNGRAAKKTSGEGRSLGRHPFFGEVTWYI